jgi:DNA replication and repair protein RecF
MQIRHLALVEFRSICSLELDVPPGGFGLAGRNAAGKSSVLEAIAMLATTRSSRAALERELIRWSSGEELGVPPYACVQADIVTADRERTIEIGMQLEGPRSNRVRKVIELDGKRARARKVVGTLKCVLFEPADIDLVSGPPSLRRKYLDVMLSQLDPVYLSSLSRYGRIVEQRNSLIKSLVRDNQGPQSTFARSQLDFWDSELVAHGAKIVHRRLAAVGKLAGCAGARLAEFTGGSDLSVRYAASSGRSDRENGTESRAPLPIERAGQSESEVAFTMSLMIEQVRNDEFRRGISLVGPHRDDLVIATDDVDIGRFGSRGQQRLAAVAMKLAEADVMRSVSGEQPVILLDDVFSELDTRHRGLLSQSIGGLGAQLIVTATEHESIPLEDLALDTMLTIEDGVLKTSDPAASGGSERIQSEIT